MSLRVFKALAAWALVLGPTPLFAHATLDRKEAPAGGVYNMVIAINHGCDGQPTLRVRVRIPKGVTGVTPQPKTGWDISVRKEKLAQSIKDNQGATITETAAEVMWSGKLADEKTDEFVMQVTLPDRPGAILYFPTVQECETGVQRWIELPAAGKSLNSPAPALKLTPKS